MGRPPRCAVCYSENAAQLNTNLNAGAGFQATGKLFKINRKAIAKHVRDGHPGIDGRPRPTDPAALPPEPSATPESRLRGLIERLETDMTDSTGPVRPELARELRMAYTELAKISSATPDAVKINDVEGLPELLKDLFLALEPFPDARAAMADVLRERMEMNDG